MYIFLPFSFSCFYLRQFPGYNDTVTVTTDGKSEHYGQLYKIQSSWTKDTLANLLDHMFLPLNMYKQRVRVRLVLRCLQSGVPRLHMKKNKTLRKRSWERLQLTGTKTVTGLLNLI
jgi:hypothetical protein